VRATLPHLVVSAVVLDPDARHVLLVRDGRHARWRLVGGHVDGGEPLSEAVRREVRDQTGLSRFRVIEPHLAVQQDLLPCGEVEALHVDHVFTVVTDPAEAVVEGPLDDSGQAAWHHVRALPDAVSPGVRLHLGSALRAVDSPA